MYIVSRIDTIIVSSLIHYIHNINICKLKISESRILINASNILVEERCIVFINKHGKELGAIKMILCMDQSEYDSSNGSEYWPRDVFWVMSLYNIDHSEKEISRSTAYYTVDIIEEHNGIE